MQFKTIMLKNPSISQGYARLFKGFRGFSNKKATNYFDFTIFLYSNTYIFVLKLYFKKLLFIKLNFLCD